MTIARAASRSPSIATDGFVEIVEAFGRGVTSMYLHNSGSAGQQKKNVGADNFATVPLPVGPAGKRVSFWFSETLTMFKGAKNKDGAWAFMSFMLDDEPSLKYNSTLGLLSARKSILAQPEFAKDPAQAGFINSFPIGVVSPYLAYPGWGGYGSSKAALEQISAILAEENPAWRIYWVDPGDMRTQMHQEAFPDEDISDRPLPDSVVPAFLKLLSDRPESGRMRL